ncbi:MAG: hemerythrin domain-containing protein [Bdellovibrionota bacterium]
MQIYEALKKDHDAVKKLLQRLEGSADADQETRSALIEKIRDELIPHSRAEEAVFYNSLRYIDEAKDLVRHGYQEHMEAEALLRTLQGMDALNADWTTVARKLKDAVEHHIEEEEGEIFAAAKQLLAEEEATAMAEVFEQMKPQVREEGFMKNTFDGIINTMPPRFIEPFRNFFLRR